MEHYLTLDQATAEAMTMIGADSSDSRIRNISRTWVARAVNEIGTGKYNIKVCILNANDGSFKKPPHTKSIIDIALFSDTVEVPYRYRGGKSRIHNKRTNFINKDGITQIDISEDAYYIHMGDGCDAVTHAAIRYYEYPVDEDGNLLITQDMMPAIIQYVRYANSMRKNSNRSEIEQNRQAWISDRNAARSRIKTPSQLEGEEIAKTWMSMIPKRFFNDF